MLSTRTDIIPDCGNLLRTAIHHCIQLQDGIQSLGRKRTIAAGELRSHASSCPAPCWKKFRPSHPRAAVRCRHGPGAQSCLCDSRSEHGFTRWNSEHGFTRWKAPRIVEVSGLEASSERIRGLSEGPQVFHGSEKCSIAFCTTYQAEEP